MNITDEASLKFSMAQILGLPETAIIKEVRPVKYQVLVVEQNAPGVNLNTTSAWHTVEVN